MIFIEFCTLLYLISIFSGISEIILLIIVWAIVWILIFLKNLHNKNRKLVTISRFILIIVTFFVTFVILFNTFIFRLSSTIILKGIVYDIKKSLGDVSLHLLVPWWMKNSVFYDNNWLNTPFIGAKQIDRVLQYYNFSILDRSFVAFMYFFLNNLILSHNLFLVLSFLLTYLSTFLIAKKISKDFFASLLAAITFSFSYIRVVAFLENQPNLLITFFLPLLLYLFFKYEKERKTKYLLTFGVLFGLQLIADFQIAYFSSLFIFLYFITYALAERKQSYFFLIILVSIVFSLLALPNILSFINLNREFFSTGLPFPLLNIDNWNIFIKNSGGCIPNRYYILPLLIFFAPISLFYDKKWLPIFFISSSILFWFLSTGIGWQTLKEIIPFYNWGMRLPARFILISNFSLSLSLAISFANIRKILIRDFFEVEALIFLLFLVLLVEEIRLSCVSIIDVYSTFFQDSAYNFIANDTSDFSILEIPNDGEISGYYFFMMLKHNKPLLNVHSNAWFAFLKEIYYANSSIRALPPSEIIEASKINDSIALLKRANVKYVIVHKDIMKEEDFKKISGLLQMINYTVDRDFNNTIVFVKKPDFQ